MNCSVASVEDGTDRGANSRKGKSLSFAECNLDNYKQQRSSFWVRLKKRRARRGVVDVDVDHHRFPTLAALKIGLRKIIEEHPELSAKGYVEHTDCKHVQEERIPLAGGKECVFRSFASTAFASLRRSMEVTEEEFLEAVAPHSLPFLEFISNSKSGQDFFFSNNQKFMLKTERLACISHFNNILWDYIQHLLMYPHSLLVKFLGLYSIKMPGLKIKYFMVMQSVFYPGSLIQARFDLKGCTAGRFQPNTTGDDELTVLKDVNFLNDKVHIELGVQSDWFRRQLLIDTAFLKQVRVLDYSLLVARQQLPASSSSQSLPTVISRVSRSMTKFSTCRQSLPPHSSNVTANSLHDSRDILDAMPTSPRRHKGKLNAVVPFPDHEVTSVPQTDGIKVVKLSEQDNIEEEKGSGTDGEESNVGGMSDSRGHGCVDDRVEPLNLSSALGKEGAANTVSDANQKQDGGQVHLQTNQAWTSTIENNHAGSSRENPESNHAFEDFCSSNKDDSAKYDPNKDSLPSARKNNSVRPTSLSAASDVAITTPRLDMASRSKTSRPPSVSQVSQSRSEHTNFSLEMQSLPGSAVSRSAAASAASATNQRQSLTSRHFGSLKDREAENRRLLPNCENALHIIDGPHDRYYVGLVDFFTRYQCWQRTAHYVKAVRYRSCDHSTLAPNEYADRLVDFVLRRVR